MATAILTIDLEHSWKGKEKVRARKRGKKAMPTD
jgi:hypothetical protein